MPLSLKLKNRIKKQPTGPVWAGPCGEGPQGGITQSLVNDWLYCRERFRLKVIEGLAPPDRFHHKMEYGSMWHVCEEAHAGKVNWELALATYMQDLIRRYPSDQHAVRHWGQVCATQFPVYMDWWSQHPDVKGRKPLLQETCFDVPYELPSGRVVRLRGKWDSVDLINRGVYLQENKTKSDIDEQALKRNLHFDLQTMLYLIALKENEWQPGPIKGVRYNVIRRPLSGGKGSIVQKKGSKNVPAETGDEYHKRLKEQVLEVAIGPDWGMPPGEHYFFRRWMVEVSQADIERFERECLEPVLENICDDYEWWDYCQQAKENPFNSFMRQEFLPKPHYPRHYRLPYGVWNPTAEGFNHELDEYLNTGSTAGLTRVKTLFKELEDA